MNKKHLTVCLFACLSWTQLQANNQKFITIIGPDGFPMVVPMEPRQDKVVPIQSEKPIKVTPIKTVPIKENVIQINTPVVEPSATIKPAIIDAKEEVKVRPQATVVTNVPVPKVAISPIVTPEKVQAATVQPAETQPFTVIDGEKYYDSEYLESKEFNLEEKHRFYQIPMGAGSAGNWEVVERTKGADMSWFNLRDRQNQRINEVVTLGKDYQVISQDILQQALPVSCLSEKVLKKAKDLKERSVSFWPRAPLNDDFDFELAALGDRKIQNIRLSSFLKSEKDNRYYWPMVVFLDVKGCVVEGATGYFTQEFAATPLQTASIEGVVHVPNNTSYILLTPLEAAVDLPEKQLSNQGQITLTVLR